MMGFRLFGLVGFVLIFVSLVFALFVVDFSSSSSSSLQQQYEQQSGVVGDDWVLSFVSGTEYFPGQQGQIIVEARYRNGSSAIVPGDLVIVAFDEPFVTVYDNISEDRTGLVFGGEDIWVGKDTYMDGGPFAGSALTFGKFPESYSTTYGCLWDNASLDVSYRPMYRCGTPSYKAMQREVESGVHVAGFNAVLSISQPDSDGGDTTLTYAHVLVVDGDAGTWRYTTERFAYPPPSTETYFGPMSGRGLTFDLLNFELWEVIDGNMTLLGQRTDLMNNFCTRTPDQKDCVGAKNSATARKNFSMYVWNGWVYVYFDGSLIIEARTDYWLSENTTYGFVSQLRNFNIYSTLLNVHYVEDILAQDVAFLERTSCTSSVWFPDKQFYLDSVDMFFMFASENAFVDFVVPSLDGVYEYQADCLIDSVSRKISKSFHVTKKRIRAEVVK